MILEDLLIGRCTQFEMFNYFTFCGGCFIALSWHGSFLQMWKME